MIFGGVVKVYVSSVFSRVEAQQCDDLEVPFEFSLKDRSNRNSNPRRERMETSKPMIIVFISGASAYHVHEIQA